MEETSAPRIIYVEGLAGAGKTSFIARAQNECKRYTVLDEYLSEESSDTRKKLDTFIKHTEAKMKALSSYTNELHVLVDRGPLSMLVNAYVETQQGINDTYEEAMQWYKQANASGLLIVPDMYVYITASQELIEQRARDGGWYRSDLGWLANPQLAMAHYEFLFKELHPEVPILRLDGQKGSEMLVAEFLDQEQQAGYC